MTVEQLLKEYLLLASQAFQAKTNYFHYYLLYTTSQGMNKEAREFYIQNEKEYDKLSSKLIHLDDILLAKGVDAEFLEKVRF